MNGTPDLMAAGVKMVAALGVVLAILVVLLYATKKLAAHRRGAMGGCRMQVLETLHVGVKKSVSLVRVPGRVLVLGITSDKIEVLDKLEEELAGQRPPSAATGSFKTVLMKRLRGSVNRSTREVSA